MDRSQRQRRRRAIAADLEVAGFALQAAATRRGDLLPRVIRQADRVAIEEIHGRHGVEIAHTWGEPWPLRNVAHQLGAPGRGWWVPDGGIVTWPSHGGASHAGRLERLGLPPEWRPRYQPDPGCHERGEDLALAFTISAHGWLADELGQPLHEPQRAAVAAAIVLAFAESQYCRFGARQQARLEPGPHTEARSRLSGEDHRVGVARLLGDGELRRCPEEPQAYRLAAPTRVALIKRHQLDLAWAVAPGEPGVDPTDAIAAELASARREAAAERSCP